MIENPNTDYNGRYYSAVKSGQDWAVNVYPVTQDVLQKEVEQDVEDSTDTCGFFHTPIENFHDNNSMLEFLKTEKFSVWTN